MLVLENRCAKERYHEFAGGPLKITLEVCRESEQIHPDFGWSPSQIMTLSELFRPKSDLCLPNRPLASISGVHPCLHPFAWQLGPPMISPHQPKPVYSYHLRQDWRLIDGSRGPRYWSPGEHDRSRISARRLCKLLCLFLPVSFSVLDAGRQSVQYPAGQTNTASGVEFEAPRTSPFPS